MAETRVLTPSLGLEVVDAENLLADDTLITRCVEALRWRGVLLVRGANLDDDQQLALSRKIGEVVSVGEQQIFTVSLDPAKTPSAAYLKGTFNWHLDGTTDEVPVKATTLTARHIATVGGDTEFANTYAAYENLSEEDRERYEGLKVVHSFEASQRRVTPNPTQKQIAGWRSVGSREVSLVWKRRDGRRSLVIGATADHIVGMDRKESDELLDELLAFSTQERFRHTHKWAVGDLVVWDNTGVLHRATPYSEDSERTMHRTTIVGEEAFT